MFTFAFRVTANTDFMADPDFKDNTNFLFFLLICLCPSCLVGFCNVTHTEGR